MAINRVLVIDLARMPQGSVFNLHTPAAQAALRGLPRKRLSADRPARTADEELTAARESALRNRETALTAIPRTVVIKIIDDKEHELAWSAFSDYVAALELQAMAVAPASAAHAQQPPASAAHAAASAAQQPPASAALAPRPPNDWQSAARALTSGASPRTRRLHCLVGRRDGRQDALER